MSSHDDATTTPPDTRTGLSRLRPHQLAIVLGLGIAVFTAVSGIVPQITGWKNDNAIHRTVFVNVPDPLVVA
ncbi:MAG: hypothetical protein HKN41_01295, partial [Ilumatobacter sp.]|nr:hypothetical protein [Ilumatobacter sp.]